MRVHTDLHGPTHTYVILVTWPKKPKPQPPQIKHSSKNHMTHTPPAHINFPPLRPILSLFFPPHTKKNKNRSSPTQMPNSIPSAAAFLLSDRDQKEDSNAISQIPPFLSFCLFLGVKKKNQKSVGSLLAYIYIYIYIYIERERERVVYDFFFFFYFY